MNVGIKYCGGCNPTYDRRALFSAILLLLAPHKVEPVQANQCYDYILVLAGCLRQCVNLTELSAQKEILVLTSPEGLKESLAPLLK